MVKKNETIVSVIALAVGAFLLGRVMRRNKVGTDALSGANDNFKQSYQKAGSAEMQSISYLGRKAKYMFIII